MRVKEILSVALTHDVGACRRRRVNCPDGRRSIARVPLTQLCLRLSAKMYDDVYARARHERLTMGEYIRRQLTRPPRVRLRIDPSRSTDARVKELEPKACRTREPSQPRSIDRARSASRGRSRDRAHDRATRVWNSSGTENTTPAGIVRADTVRRRHPGVRTSRASGRRARARSAESRCRDRRRRSCARSQAFD